MLTKLNQNQKPTHLQISRYLIVVSSISGLPIKSTSLATTENALDDENSQIIIKSNQPPETAPLADHIYDDLDATLRRPYRNHIQRFPRDSNDQYGKSTNPPTTATMTNKNLDATTSSQSLKRVKRRVILRPLFVYRRFHPQERVNKSKLVTRRQNRRRIDQYHKNIDGLRRDTHADNNRRHFSRSGDTYLHGHYSRSNSPFSYYYDV